MLFCAVRSFDNFFVVYECDDPINILQKPKEYIPLNQKAMHERDALSKQSTPTPIKA